MAKRKFDKKISTVEASFEDVLVCRKNSERNLMEIFVEAPENVSQENLGTLAGILEITDKSADSSYIVNYLVSVIKKEYFSKTKRGAIESFEASLNKANLALAKLAEHGNVNWLGKINAILLVIEKNNIHLSQAGTAKALLLRGKALTDISEGAPISENPNPFKTFVDVLSGRIEKDDALIIATEAIFEIFSFEEIKRSAIKFSSSEFIQFLKTALGNELEKAAVLVARMEEKKLPLENSWEAPKDTEFNAFSQASFSKTSPKKSEKEIMGTEEKKSLAKEIQEDLKKESDEFIDKKTGHIYIKEDYSLDEKNHILENILEAGWMKITNFFSFLFKKTLSLLPRPEKNEETKEIAEDIPENVPVSPEEPQKPLIDKEKAIIAIKDFYYFSKRILLVFFSFLIFLGKKTILGMKTFLPKKQASSAARIAVPSDRVSFFQKIRPRFGKIKETFVKLEYSQKLYAILAIALIFIIPYFVVKIQNKKNADNIVSEDSASNTSLPLEQDKNISRIDNLESVFSKSDLFKIVNLNGKMFFVDKNGLTSAEDQKDYSFPADFAPLKIVSNMDDLNLIFFINKNNKIISWSPISKKFQDNTIEIPEGTNLALAKTYLTYLYLLDKNANQIYRYPRSGSGFGEKTNWLKDNLNLNEISDIAVGENIYLVQNSGVISLLKGKKQEFRIEETATPIFADKLYTKRNSPNLYVLDKKNSRIIKLDLSGNIISEFYNSEISEATDFEINEDSNMVYFSNENEVKSFEMK
ncbi:MAG TPA: hypothetical protein P5232_01230 [Candidatus Moranbacteria bacterium]|nr:hypothetical protein [Candidatus Moranbacteria bacterium]